MSSRERKRAERRKRKQRSSEREGATIDAPSGNGAAADGAGAAQDAAIDIAAEAEARGMSRSQIKDERAREALEPLEAGERPTVVTVGAVVSLLIALVTVGAWIAGAEVSGERPSAFQVFAPAVLFALMAWGMWRARYWAVLGFQAIMAILMLGSFLSLIAATSVPRAIPPIVVFFGAGALFWRTVKALARIQMPDRHLPS